MEPKERPLTNADLVPRGMCPSLVMKKMLINAMEDWVYDDRTQPGDGYYWCINTSKQVGPDDNLCDPDSCNPDRACYDGPRT